MVQAFRNSETPILGTSKNNYPEQVTKSQAIMTAIDEIVRALHDRDDDLTEKHERKEEEIIELEFIKNITWPSYVL